MVASVHIVRERKTGPPAAPVSEITPDPDSVNTVSGCLGDDRGEYSSSPSRTVWMIMDRAAVCVRVKAVLET